MDSYTDRRYKWLVLKLLLLLLRGVFSEVRWDAKEKAILAEADHIAGLYSV